MSAERDWLEGATEQDRLEHQRQTQQLLQDEERMRELDARPELDEEELEEYDGLLYEQHQVYEQLTH